MERRDFSRRMLLGASLGALLPVPRTVGAAGAAPRVAALDWGLASTVAALGAGPAAVGEVASYARWVREPALPPAVVELGLRTAPSFETLAALAPDLIAINAVNASLQPRLQRIAPTFANTIYAAEHAPVSRAIALTRELGTRLGRAAEAEALIAETEAAFSEARDRLGRRPRRPLIAVGFVDARHLRVYGAGSLFADVMGRIGLVSRWSGPTGDWGFGLAGIDALAPYPDTDLMVIEPTPPEAQASLDRPGLWSSLVAANRARIVGVPPIWAFGDLCAAGRCAALMADAIDRQDCGAACGHAPETAVGP